MASTRARATTAARKEGVSKDERKGIPEVAGNMGHTT